jgi:hypothetical protein
MVTGQFIDVMSSYVDIWLHSSVSPEKVLILHYLSDCCMSLGDSVGSEIKLHVNIVSHNTIVCSGYRKSVEVVTKIVVIFTYSSSSVGATARCGLWPVEQYLSICPYL